MSSVLCVHNYSFSLIDRVSIIRKIKVEEMLEVEFYLDQQSNTDAVLSLMSVEKIKQKKISLFSATRVSAMGKYLQSVVFDELFEKCTTQIDFMMLVVIFTLSDSRVDSR